MKTMKEITVTTKRVLMKLDRELVFKKAHEMTRDMLKKYKVDYKAQFTISLKLAYKSYTATILDEGIEDLKFLINKLTNQANDILYNFNVQGEPSEAIEKLSRVTEYRIMVKECEKRYKEIRKYLENC